MGHLSVFAVTYLNCAVQGVSGTWQSAQWLLYFNAQTLELFMQYWPLFVHSYVFPFLPLEHLHVS